MLHLSEVAPIGDRKITVKSPAGNKEPVADIQAVYIFDKHPATVVFNEYLVYLLHPKQEVAPFY
jgi:hypothetical protein